jgi:hypothetical protein
MSVQYFADNETIYGKNYSFLGLMFDIMRERGLMIYLMAMR